jgi:hypothetical protein
MSILTGGHGIDIFGASDNTVIVQGSFDRNQQDGIRFHGYTGAATHLIGVNTQLNNQSGGSFSDAHFDAGSSRGVYVTSPNMPTNYAAGTYHFQFEGGSTGTVYLNTGGGNIAGGNSGTQFTNAASQIVYASLPGGGNITSTGINLVSGGLGVGKAAISGTIGLKTATQFNGISLENASSIVAKLYGLSASNDNGVLELSAGGASRVKLSAGSGIDSYFNAGNKLGIGTIAPAATVQINGTSLLGAATAATLATGEMGLSKISASGSAPGVGVCKEAWVAGTTAGTCKKIAYCGTSTTPTTVIDNVGGGC